VCRAERLLAIVSVLKSMGVGDVDSLAKLKSRDVLNWVNQEREEEGV
jgi:hypothetical protein